MTPAISAFILDRALPRIILERYALRRDGFPLSVTARGGLATAAPRKGGGV